MNEVPAWGHPSLLSLLLLVPVVLVGGLVAWRARTRALQALGSLPAIAALLPPGVGRARGWQAALAVVAVAGMATAAAGPQLGFDWEQRRMEGVSIVVALDVSRSMDAQDVSPSRLERARRELEDLTRLLRGDAVGLVLFADGAWVRIPLTTDYATFLWATKDSSTDTIQAQGTSLGGAIDAATKMLARAPGTGKALLVVSDGEDHDEQAVVDAAVTRAREAGVRIYALGVGDAAGAPIPLAEGGFKKDAAGNVVLSRLDEERLRSLASATGGAYVRSVVSIDDVRALYEDEIRGKLEAAERGMRRDKRPRERFQWPLAVAAVAMTVSAALGIGWRRAAVLLLGLGLVAPGPAWAGAREDGFAALREERWADAARALGQARVEDPTDTQVGQGLATALYRAGRYREAEQLFDTLARTTSDPGEQAVHRYNAGNAAYRGGRLEEALADFEAAGQADPEMQAAARNAEAVRREIEARRQAQPPEPPQAGEQGEDGQAGGEPQAGQDGQAGADGQQGQDGQSGADGQQGGQQDGQPGGQPGQGGQAGAEPGEQGGPPAGTPGQDDGPRGDGQAEGQPGQEPGTEPGAGAAPGEPGEPGDEEGVGLAEGEGTGSGMTAEQAARLVESVPDGKPRVSVGGRPDGEDW